MTKDFSQLKKNLKADLSGLPKVKLALVGDTATQLLVTAIRGMGIECGYNLEVFEAEYNQVERQFFDTSSDLYQFDADFIVLFLSTHKLCEHHSQLPANEQANLARERVAFIESICHIPALESKKIICFNFPEMDDAVFGNYANKVRSSFPFQVRQLNYELMELAARTPNLNICDIASIQNKLGRDMMFAPNIYISTGEELSVMTVWKVSSWGMVLVLARPLRSFRCGLKS